jgi:hypothetical protein
MNKMFIGKYAIIRADGAGVHAGKVEAIEGQSVTLTNSRRLWYWATPKGIALSGVAQHGITLESKVDTVNPLILINGVCEIIPCSATAQQSIEAAP